MRPGEVQREWLFGPAQIMELKYQMLREVRLVAPDYPAHTSIDEAELVSGGVDWLYAG
jgi:hypothetical protein